MSKNRVKEKSKIVQYNIGLREDQWKWLEQLQASRNKTRKGNPWNRDELVRDLIDDAIALEERKQWRSK